MPLRSFHLDSAVTGGRMSSYEELTEAEIVACAAPELGAKDDLQVDWEHGQWWVTNRYTGAQWSVVETTRGLDFEQVTQGDED